MIALNKDGGTIYSLIKSKLSAYNEYIEFKEGNISLFEYRDWLYKNIEHLIDDEINEHMLMLSLRFPQDNTLFVDNLLKQISNKCTGFPILKNIGEYKIYEKHINKRYKHDGYRTYIFPEESELLYRYSKSVQAKNVLLLGSYYGYLGIWTLPSVIEQNGSAIFVDIDKKVCDLAKRNLKELNFSNFVNVVHDDAITFLMNCKDTFDLIIIDAEGSKDHLEKDRRGKRIYYPLIKNARTLLSEGGSIFMHNIMLKDSTNSQYLDSLVKKHFEEFDKFLPYVNSTYSIKMDFQTTEGIGIFLK